MQSFNHILSADVYFASFSHQYGSRLWVVPRSPIFSILFQSLTVNSTYRVIILSVWLIVLAIILLELLLNL